MTQGEIALARSVFGGAIDYAKVTIKRRKWFPFQPKRVTMAPRGHLHFHPLSKSYCEDFGSASLSLQGHFIHELTHVWQTQTLGDWYLVTHRMPWASYDYTIRPGWTLERYGIEQQAEIVRHVFLLRAGARVPGAPSLAVYEEILPFRSEKWRKPAG